MVQTTFCITCIGHFIYFYLPVFSLLLFYSFSRPITVSDSTSKALIPTAEGQT